MFKLLKKLDKKDISLIIIAILLIVVQVFLELKIPDYMTEITRLIQTEDTIIGDIKNSLTVVGSSIATSTITIHGEAIAQV